MLLNGILAICIGLAVSLILLGLKNEKPKKVKRKYKKRTDKKKAKRASKKKS